MPPENEASGRHKSSEEDKPFDAWTFKLRVNKDVPKDIITSLQNAHGSNIAQGVCLSYTFESQPSNPKPRVQSAPLTKDASGGPLS